MPFTINKDHELSPVKNYCCKSQTSFFFYDIESILRKKAFTYMEK